MFTATLCFVGGILFAAAFPQPSAMLRTKVGELVRRVFPKSP